MTQRGFLDRWHLVGTAAFILLFAAPLHAQVVPGDSPSTGLGTAVANSPRGIGGVSGSRAPTGPRSDYEGEERYRQVLRGFPDRKTSKDPWASIRSAPADRHQVQ